MTTRTFATRLGLVLLAVITVLALWTAVRQATRSEPFNPCDDRPSLGCPSD